MIRADSAEDLGPAGAATKPGNLRLTNGSRVAVIGGGPAGSFFAYFLLDMTERAGFKVDVDIYEPRDFSVTGPKGCNMCGGIVSESLVQTLAAEGIDLPPNVVQRGIDSYMLHMDVGRVQIETPLQEKRIAAVHRGPGPRDIKERKWDSFDDYLLNLAVKKGARRVRKKVENVSPIDGGLEVLTKDQERQKYDLVTVAVGVNSTALKFLEQCDVPYKSPRTTKTMICEYHLGLETLQRCMGNSMHVFLLDIPRLEFAAIVPKGEYATVCLLGDDIDKELIRSFLNSPEVKSCFPSDWNPDTPSCQCRPRMNIWGSEKPFGDRIVYIGDCGVTRLYKDGIGAAYRTAKAAAGAAVFQGISAVDFRKHYLPRCKAIARDNRVGMFTFSFTGLIQKIRPAGRGLWSMVFREQEGRDGPRRMSQVMWDLFTGSASYGSVLKRTLHPVFLLNLLRNFLSPVAAGAQSQRRSTEMKTGQLGTIYEDGEVLVRQGDVGDSMYVILEGEARVLMEKDGREVLLRTLGAGELFGEMAVFDRVVRSATVQAAGQVRALTLDKGNLMSRIQADPTLAFRIIQTMSGRIRELSAELAKYKTGTS